jgi:CheY-like chemotaxis protein
LTIRFCRRKWVFKKISFGLISARTFCVDRHPMDILRSAGAPAGGITRALRVLTVAVEKGSGLGLSQVYGFANESGGHVILRSEVGRGTTVKLYLPRCNGALEEVEDRPALAVAQRSSSGTVFVVDDDEAVLETAKETVADLGYRVMSAHNGREALQILKGFEKINLLLSDIVCPVGSMVFSWPSGRSACSLLYKVLLTSGYTAGVLTDPHGLPKQIPVLRKPYRREQLATNLREIIDGKAAERLSH